MSDDELEDEPEEDQEKPEDNAWTSSHKESLADEKIDANKIMDRGQQLQFPVPVHSTTSKLPLDVWEIDIDKVSYNFDNIRIGKYKKRHCFKLGVEELKQEEDEHQKVVQEILLNTKDYGEKATVDLKGDLVLKGQEDPALITEVGVLWNGNRRCAAMREMFENPPAGGLGKLIEGRIKVCFLPEGLNLTKLKILEKRLQQTADTKQEYGRLNQMYDIWRTLDEFEQEGGDYQNPSTEEKEEILKVVKTNEFESWGMIEHAKETLDLMDEYLDSRHTDARPLKGNYDVIEIPGKTTWFEDVRKLLRKVRSHWDNPDIEGDPEDKYDAYKTWAFTTYDQVDSKGKSTADYSQIRRITKLVENATGSGGPEDTTSLLDAFEKNSIIIDEWSELSQEEQVSLSDQTRTVRGQEIKIKTIENQNLETTADQLKQHGEDPKLLLDKLLRQIKNIDLNLVQKNDKELLVLIEKCEVELKKIEERATA